jgi:hypothetical protein
MAVLTRFDTPAFVRDIPNDPTNQSHSDRSLEREHSTHGLATGRRYPVVDGCQGVMTPSQAVELSARLSTRTSGQNRRVMPLTPLQDVVSLDELQFPWHDAGKFALGITETDELVTR